MNRPESLGNLKCRVCGVAYMTRINYLNEPVDVFAEWIDEAAENQAMLDARERAGGAAPSSSSQAPGISANEAALPQSAAGVDGY